jgi:transcription termination factor Rho
MRRMYDQMIAAPPYGPGLEPSTATEAILQRLSRTENNLRFLETLNEDNN